MKVRRYFIGFGPKIFSFRRGETEYGLKALAARRVLRHRRHDRARRARTRRDRPRDVPADDVEAPGRDVRRHRDELRARVRAGLRPRHRLGAAEPEHATRDGARRRWGASRTQDPGRLRSQECTGDGPAQRAGLQRGDVVTAVDGVPRRRPGRSSRPQTQQQTGPFTYTVERGGQDNDRAGHAGAGAAPDRRPETGRPRCATVSAIGVGPRLRRARSQYNVGHPRSLPRWRSPATCSCGPCSRWRMMPQKVVDLWHAVTGGERDLDTPISVVGASVIGGEVAERGLWEIVRPAAGEPELLPRRVQPAAAAAARRRAHGGHRLREDPQPRSAARRGLPAGGPVDYMKLMPVDLCGHRHRRRIHAAHADRRHRQPDHSSFR